MDEERSGMEEMGPVGGVIVVEVLTHVVVGFVIFQKLDNKISKNIRIKSDQEELDTGKHPLWRSIKK